MNESANFCFVIFQIKLSELLIRRLIVQHSSTIRFGNYEQIFGAADVTILEHQPLILFSQIYVPMQIPIKQNLTRFQLLVATWLFLIYQLLNLLMES